MSTTIIPYVTLLILRDETTTLCVDVPEYEQSILEAPYPEGAVQEYERYDVEVVDFDIKAAFERLVDKYASNDRTDAARLRRFERVRDLQEWVDAHQPKSDRRDKKGKKDNAGETGRQE